jgi:hypothetical protein
MHIFSHCRFDWLKHYLINIFLQGRYFTYILEIINYHKQEKTSIGRERKVDKIECMDHNDIIVEKKGD